MTDLLRSVAFIAFVAGFFIPVLLVFFLPGIAGATVLFWLFDNSISAPTTEFEMTVTSLMTVGLSLLIATKTPYGALVQSVYEWYSETAERISPSTGI